MGSSQDWDKVITRLSKKYYCIAIDLPGHGNSNHIGQHGVIWNFEAISEKLSDLLKHLEIKKTSVLGYSLGGRISLYFAIKYPQHVSNLILESASPGIEKINEREARFQNDKLLANEIQTKSFDAFLDSWYDLPLFAGIKNHPNFPKLLSNRRNNNPKLLAKALESFSPGNQPYLLPQLVNLKMPIHLICGQNDKKYLAIMNQTKLLNPHFHLKIFENSGHNVHFEKPKQFAEHLLRVLSLKTHNKL